MRKLSLFLCIVLVLAAALPLTAGAECNRVFENAPITVPKTAPTIDGVIKKDEGWSSAGKLDEDTAGYFYGQNPLTSVTDFYFAYSEEGLYFAAELTEYGSAYSVRFYDVDENDYDIWVRSRSYIDVKAGEYTYENYPEKATDGTVLDGALEPPKYDSVAKRDPSQEHIKAAFWYTTAGNTNAYSEGDDMVDNDYGWDGDVFALMFDALGTFNVPELWGDTDYAPQYNIGIFEGDVVKIKTSRVSDTDITDKCKAAGKLTSDKIVFEVLIPWDQIVKDSNDFAASNGISHTFTKEELIADGAAHRASVTLMDRFYDPDAGYIDSWGRFITVCSECDDGTSGCVVGPPVKAFGLKLNMGSTKASDESAKPGDDTSGDGNTVTDEDGKIVTDKDGKAVTGNKSAAGTTKAAGTKTGGGSGSSAQTGDPGIIIAVAVAVVAVSAIAFVFKKRSK